jgi:hypothetical protein
LAYTKHDRFSEIFDIITDSFGISESRNLLVEAYVVFVTWSCTYLFIRRWCNPDTNATAFQKFAIDSLFGGLAASSSVFIKHALNKSLKK